MIINTKQLAVAGLLVTGLFSATVCARADDKDAPKTTVVGILDGYYQYSFNHPPPGATVGSRAFDVKSDSFSLSLVKIDINRTTTAKSPLGFTATLTLGKTADIVHATEPGGTNTYKYLQQLYGTYVLATKIPITIDAGKFVTWNGTEVIGSTSNDNYSGSLLFTYAIPFYHMGVRGTFVLNDKVTAGLYAVNGWNDVEDSNGGKTLGASLSLTPTKTLNLIVNYTGGDEGSMTATGAAGTFGGIGFPAKAILNTQLVDVQGTFNPTPKIKLAANVDYATASKKGQTGGTWDGEAIYGKYQFTPVMDLALRGEVLSDHGGLRTGTVQRLSEVTATLEYDWKTNLVSKLEYRHDVSNTAFFPSGGGGRKDQDTVLVGEVIKF